MRIVFVGAGGINGIGSAAGGHVIFLMNNLLGVLRENSDALQFRNLALPLSYHTAIIISYADKRLISEH